MTDAPNSEWSRAVVRVGGGRGTIVETKRGERYIITAAHCLPGQPPPHAASRTEERTYAKLVGTLGAEPTVWAECLFADPVADLAVLCSPDGQAFSDESEAYDALLEGAGRLPLGSLSYARKTHTHPDGSTVLLPPRAESAAWLLSLGGQWFACRVESSGRGLWIAERSARIEGGMSGSPIVSQHGEALGVISTGHWDPLLAASLPAWIVRALTPRRHNSGARRRVKPRAENAFP